MEELGKEQLCVYVPLSRPVSVPVPVPATNGEGKWEGAHHSLPHASLSLPLRSTVTYFFYPLFLLSFFCIDDSPGKGFGWFGTHRLFFRGICLFLFLDSSRLFHSLPQGVRLPCVYAAFLF